MTFYWNGSYAWLEIELGRRYSLFVWVWNGPLFSLSLWESDEGDTWIPWY